MRDDRAVSTGLTDLLMKDSQCGAYLLHGKGMSQLEAGADRGNL
jgi:hypothetical protein